MIIKIKGFNAKIDKRKEKIYRRYHNRKKECSKNKNKLYKIQGEKETPGEPITFYITVVCSNILRNTKVVGIR
jgi:hypothetical protein